MRRAVLSLLLLACGGPPPERATPRAVTNQDMEVASVEAPFTVERLERGLPSGQAIEWATR